MNFSDSTAKVLIVDDEPNIVMAVEFLLQREGYQTEKAYNGQQALEIAARFLPDIVILDVMMSGMNGFEVAQHIREQPSLEYTKIMATIPIYTQLHNWLIINGYIFCFKMIDFCLSLLLIIHINYGKRKRYT